MEFQDKVNAILIPMTHYFNASRMPDLAIANVLALVMMNMSNKRDKYFLMVNGIFTYLMGYTFFLDQKPSSGVYMFLLGILCMGTSVADTFQSIYDDWNSRFRIQKEVVYDESDTEDEDEGAQAPNPTLSEADASVAPASAVCSTAEQTTAPEHSVESQTTAPEPPTTEQTTAPIPESTPEETSSTKVPTGQSLAPET